MKTFPVCSQRRTAIADGDGSRFMMKCAAGYVFASALATALGISGMGHLSLAAVVWLLLMAALLLAAGMLCGALGTMGAQPSGRHSDTRH